MFVCVCIHICSRERERERKEKRVIEKLSVKIKNPVGECIAVYYIVFLQSVILLQCKHRHKKPKMLLTPNLNFTGKDMGI